MLNVYYFVVSFVVWRECSYEREKVFGLDSLYFGEDTVIK